MEVQIDNRQNRRRINPTKIRPIATALLSASGFDNAELSLSFVDDDEITRLNQTYLQREGPTNVIAFPMGEAGAEGSAAPDHMLGDVVISVDTAMREAAAAGMRVHDRIVDLLIHGVLHLIGYDHEAGTDEASRMEEAALRLHRRLAAAGLTGAAADDNPFPFWLTTADEMRAADRTAIDEYGIPGRVLMESAGWGAVRAILRTFPNLRNNRVVVLAGCGNNGGDGFVIARGLAGRGIASKVLLFGTREKVIGEAADNLALLDSLYIPVAEVTGEADWHAVKSSIAEAPVGLIVDALLGTGLKSDVRGVMNAAIRFLNRVPAPVFAVDIPSGIDADTGRICGVAVKAEATATFACAKPGHFLYPGREYTGRLTVVDIGIPPAAVEAASPRVRLTTPPDFEDLLSPRPKNAHKGTFGHALIVAGSRGKTGAALLSAKGALRAGAGLVTLGMPGRLLAATAPALAEMMTLPLPDDEDGVLDAAATEAVIAALSGKNCLALGPGLSVNPAVRRLTDRLVRECPLPLVIDADGLNCLAENPAAVAERIDPAVPVVLTPHPGEAARLLNVEPAAVQSDRVGSAGRLAETTRAVVVLKGAGTVIACPDGERFVNPTGGPRLAAAGMGDVLTGVIAGFIARGYPAKTAALAGVYLHGMAGETPESSGTDAGVLAGEIADAIPDAFTRIRRNPDSGPPDPWDP